MSSFLLEMLNPDKTIYYGKVTSATAKAIDGEVQVLMSHVPYLNVLPAGEVRLTTEENTCLHFKHNGGMLCVAKDKTSLLVY